MTNSVNKPVDLDHVGQLNHAANTQVDHTLRYVVAEQLEAALDEAVLCSIAYWDFQRFFHRAVLLPHSELSNAKGTP